MGIAMSIIHSQSHCCALSQSEELLWLANKQLVLLPRIDQSENAKVASLAVGQYLNFPLYKQFYLSCFTFMLNPLISNN
jgi:hypothetical protein